MLVWFTESSIFQFHATEQFLFKRSYIKHAPSAKKKKKKKKNSTKTFQITNWLFLRKMVTDKWGLLLENDPYVKTADF